MKRHNKRGIDSAREEQIIRQNAAAINAANGRMLTVILMIGIVIFALLWGLTFVLADYRPLRIVYGLIIVSLVFVHVLSQLPSMKTSAIVWLYCAFCAYAANTAFCGIFITPGGSGVMILGCLVLLPTLTLDVSWRVNLVEVVTGVVYLILVVPNKTGMAGENELVNVCAFAAASLAAGGFLRRARLENFELERQTALRETTDYLTGLSNRRKLFEFLSENEHRDCTAPITGMLMIDVDYFKLYNDSYGHLAGDECLRRIGNYLKHLSESYPVTFFRYGGEEFLGTTNDFSREELVCFCDKLLSDVRGMRIENRAVARGQVTISIGMTLAEPTAERHYECMISEADSALYFAKRNGRDRAVCFKEGMMEAPLPTFRKY